MTADEIIQALHLKPHPKERGYFVESYRSEHSTAIYFLLRRGGFSEMHRLSSDEVFHFYTGSPVELLLLHPDGHGEWIRLGTDLASGEMPQAIVPRGTWQGMRSTGEYSLIGTTVAPPFQYSDYESGKRDQLIQMFPEFAEAIRALTED